MRVDTKAQEIELGNLTAHLASIKTNVLAANAELEVALSKKTEVKRQIEELSGDLAVLDARRKDIVLMFEQREKSAIHAEKELAQTRDAFIKEKAEEEERIRQLLADTQKAYDELNRRIGELSGEETELCKTIVMLRDDFNKAQAEFDTLSKRIADETERMQTQLRTLTEEVSKKGEDLAKLEAVFIREQKKKYAELEALRLEVEAEKAKIQKPAQLIAEKHDELDKRERNLLVIYERTKKAWAIMHPGQNLDEVIK